MATTHSTAIRTVLADAVVDAVDAGTADANGDLQFTTSGDVEVALLQFANPAFGAAASGVATANAITSDTNATGGVVAKGKLRNRDNTVIVQGAVGTSGTEFIISSTTIGASDTVECSSLTYTAPA